MERIKLIWDFRGADSSEMARHHARHLEQYAAMHTLDDTRCGYESVTDNHHCAWIFIKPENLTTVRDALRPHRGEQHTLPDN